MPSKTASLKLPTDQNDVVLRFGAREVRLTYLKKLFWQKL
jgi:hypothetical protein